MSETDKHKKARMRIRYLAKVGWSYRKIALRLGVSLAYVMRMATRKSEAQS